MGVPSIPVPPFQPPLPDHLDASVHMYCRARGFSADGDITLVGLAARAAAERAVKWLESEGLIVLRPFRRPEDNIHKTRFRAAGAVLGLPGLQGLLDASDADEFGDRPDGKRLRFGEQQADVALEATERVILAVAQFGAERGRLSADGLAAVRSQVASAPEPGGLDRMIAAVHRGVVDAQYSPFLEDQLRYLVTVTSRPRRSREQARAGQVSVIVAWQALNQGRLNESGGALEWANRGAKFLQAGGDKRALVESLIVIAITEKFLGRHTKAFQMLRLTEAIAGEHRELKQDVRTQQVMTAIEVNPDVKTVCMAEDVVHAAEELGDPTWVANQRMMLGRVLDTAGRIAEAEAVFDAGLHGQVKDHLMSRCNGMRYLMHFYARHGIDMEARRWAKRLRRLAAPRGLKRHVHEANMILKRESPTT